MPPQKSEHEEATSQAENKEGEKEEEEISF